MQNNPEDKPKNQSPLGGLGSGYAVGLNFVSSVVVGVLFGLGLDMFLGTKPWLLIIFLFLGIGAGFRTIWVFMKVPPPKKNDE